MRSDLDLRERMQQPLLIADKVSEAGILTSFDEAVQQVKRLCG